MRNPIGVAIIGTGFGGLVHLPAYTLHEKFRPIGIFGRSPEKTNALATAYSVKAFGSLDEAILNDEVELVSIATIPSEHFAVTSQAIAAGRHVILEKPMAQNASESALLLRAADEAGIFHAIAHEHRFDPSRIYAAHLVRQRSHGALRCIEIVKHLTYWSESHAGRSHDWFSDKTLGGGMTGAHLSHQLDFLHCLDGAPVRWVAGKGFIEVKDRYCHETGNFEPHTSDQTVLAIAETATGVPVRIDISASRHRQQDRVTFYTSEGEITITGPRAIQIKDKEGRVLSDRIPKPFLIPDYGKDTRLDTFMVLLSAFYGHYLDRAPPQITTFREGHQTQRLLEGIVR